MYIIPSINCVFLSNLFFRNNKCIDRILTNAVKYYNYNNCLINSSSFSCRNKRREPPWRIIYFGTDEFSLSCLQPLYAKLNTRTLISSLGVVSEISSQVYNFAVSSRLPIHEWPPGGNILNEYDIGIVVSFGKLIPERIIDSLPLWVLNVHGSLLPKWRGAAPIAYAIMNGDVETGVTVMQIKPHIFDTGDIVKQYRCPISPTETTPELSMKLAKHASNLLMDCVRDLPRCLDVATPQPTVGVSFAPKLTGNMNKIDWRKLSANNVYNLHRALSHKQVLCTTWFGKPVKLYNVTLEKEYRSLSEREGRQVKSSESIPSASHRSALEFLNSSDSVTIVDGNKRGLNANAVVENGFPGKLLYNKNSTVLKVQCADGKYIECSNLKVASGRNVMTTADFYNGYLSKVDKKEWHFE